MTGVAAILLAAGQSRRMGAFKPLLPFGTQTVIESCISCLVSGGADSVIVVVGHRADEIRKQLDSVPVGFTFNNDPRSEMGTSISLGVRALPETTQAVIIALVDYPAVPTSVVSSLINEWANGARLVKPTFEGRGGHPVLIDLKYRDELLNIDPKTGLKQLFSAHQNDVRALPVATPYIARDIDTWDDYTRLYVDVFGKVPELGER